LSEPQTVTEIPRHGPIAPSTIQLSTIR
jgi:hypothetical protein